MTKLILVLTILPYLCFGQKIEENKYDKFDSAIKIKTTTEYLSSKKNDEQGELRTFVSSNILLSPKYKDIQKKDAAIFLVFKSLGVTSLNDDSKTKIIFSDGSTGEYKYEGRTQIIGSEDVAIMYFIVDLNSSDKIITQNIQSIRISLSDENRDFDLPINKQDIIKNCLSLVKSELDKIPKQE